jgi:hypothetical protein
VSAGLAVWTGGGVPAAAVSGCIVGLGTQVIDQRLGSRAGRIAKAVDVTIAIYNLRKGLHQRVKKWYENYYAISR